MASDLEDRVAVLEEKVNELFPGKTQAQADREAAEAQAEADKAEAKAAKS